MKKFILILLCIMMALLQGCVKDNNISSVDISKYGEWQGFAKETIEKKQLNVLPSKELVDAYGNEYYYKSSQGIFGDPNYVIYTVLDFQNMEKDYIAEVQRITNNNDVFYDTSTYCCISNVDIDSLKEYCNQSIIDGMFFDFNLILVNKEQKIISFVSAYVWDYYKDDKLECFVEKIIQEKENN